MRRWLWMIIAVVVLACVACSAPVAGAPAADPTVTAPGRPRDIPLQGIDDACSVLTLQQRARLGLDPESKSTVSSSRLLGATQNCTIIGFRPRAISVSLALAPETGIQRIRDAELVAQLTPITIRDYPALVVRPADFADVCVVDVDIAEGQVIDLQFRDGGVKPPIGQDQLCRDAQVVATEIVTSLLAH